MAIQPGIYTETTIVNTTIDDLKPFVGMQGTLYVHQNNYILFKYGEPRVPLFVNLSLGDFSVPNCKELWIQCDAGEATFSRSCINPLWEMEKKKAFETL